MTERAGGWVTTMRGMCSRCNCCELVREECWSCGGEGCFDEHETDPINCDPGEFFTDCDICEGQGRYTICSGHCDASGKHAADPADAEDDA